MAAGKYARWLEPDSLVLLEGWARDGLTLEQIAHNVGCSYSTFRDWMGKYPAISAAVKKGQEVVNYEVENALLKSALGYTYEEKTVEQDGGTKKVRVTFKTVPPNVAAQIFWLKNRTRGKWRDKPENESDGKELEKLAAILGGIESGF